MPLLALSQIVIVPRPSSAQRRKVSGGRRRSAGVWRARHAEPRPLGHAEIETVMGYGVLAFRTCSGWWKGGKP